MSLFSVAFVNKASGQTVKVIHFECMTLEAARSAAAYHCGPDELIGPIGELTTPLPEAITKIEGLANSAAESLSRLEKAIQSPLLRKPVKTISWAIAIGWLKVLAVSILLSLFVFGLFLFLGIGSEFLFTYS